RAANEGSAQSSLRTIHSSEATYQATNGNGAYADTLALLQGANLIDSVLGGGTKSGFAFSMATDTGGTGATAVFGAVAYPVTTSGVSQTGTRQFGITEVGVMYGAPVQAAAPTTRAGIIAAITIPNLLASRRAANEGSAQSSLRTIHSSEATYQATNGNGAYADT